MYPLIGLQIAGRQRWFGQQVFRLLQRRLRGQRRGSVEQRGDAGNVVLERELKPELIQQAVYLYTYKLISHFDLPRHSVSACHLASQAGVPPGNPEPPD